MSWFRHYIGLCRDAKLVACAARSKQSLERVVWVWCAILESAKERNEDGKYEFDTEEVAYFLRCDVTDLNAIITSLASLNRIGDGAVTAWGERQYVTDTSRQRQKEYRDRKKQQRYVTPPSPLKETLQSDGAVTAPETETETETEGISPYPFSKPKEAEFEEFWNSYPEMGRVGWEKTKAAWGDLTDTERIQATDSLPAFKAWVARQHADYTTLHAASYLEKKRFKDYAAGSVKTIQPSVTVHVGTPEFEAWMKHFEAKGHRNVSVFKKQGRAMVASPWPPGNKPNPVGSDLSGARPRTDETGDPYPAGRNYSHGKLPGPHGEVMRNGVASPVSAIAVEAVK